MMDGLTKKKIEYFRAQLLSDLHKAILSQYSLYAKSLAVEELARRLQTTPERICKILSSPEKLTLDSASDILLAMGVEPQFELSHTQASHD
jgi:plasmid maintenance system antidote protein VapI